MLLIDRSEEITIDEWIMHKSGKWTERENSGGEECRVQFGRGSVVEWGWQEEVRIE